jgi:hypothetical protein
MWYLKYITVVTSCLIIGSSCKSTITQRQETYQSVMSKIKFDRTKLDHNGLIGPEDGKRSLDYEYCIPNTPKHKSEVQRIDLNVKFLEESKGRINCKQGTILCISNTHQRHYYDVLELLAKLKYVYEIREVFYE